jgi:predicted 2-oxoglutarate/Fe(II)-dependent dioxygenase YbiX/peroxiredoxin
MTSEVNYARYADLQPGDTAPTFRQRSLSNPRYTFDVAAGRYLVLCFFASAADEMGREALRAATARPDLFNDDHASFFGVSFDPADESEGRLKERYPGYRFLLDFDGAAGRLYGALPADAPEAAALQIPRQLWVVLSPDMRVLGCFPFGPGAHERAMNFLAALPEPRLSAGFAVQAPILVLPQVFEPDLCRRLIAAYEQAGGEMSGFMREEDGKTVLKHDGGHKKRRDHELTDPALIAEARGKIHRRIVPQIQKAHQFEVTRMERHLVGCYTAEDGGHFRAHRDNTTKGTAHRRFAVSINLNAEFEGGEIGFPEYGPQTLKPPPGGAVVFSCSLLHQVSPVTKGARYAFLPFLYDEAAARIREQNAAFLAQGSNYRAGGVAGHA